MELRLTHCDMNPPGALVYVHPALFSVHLGESIVISASACAATPTGLEL
jgi:hypothetical protein